ncbi:metalloregulator ArsR/SmtB family transcription factor [candidate division KSB1 bacterium]|nr:metalloregulator ArsR/SmtB family transcription factor [candidate division KSB1 bacterium]
MKELAQVFKALSDEARLRILNLIMTAGEICVCDIQRVLGYCQPKVSRHLAYLKNSGLVEDRREGLWIIYTLAKLDQESFSLLKEYLQTAFAQHPHFEKDRTALNKAIAGGKCVSIPMPQKVQ